MRVAVIRGDVPSPIFLADLEPTSGFNPPTEPFGQSQYIEYPSAAALTNLLAGVYSADAEGKIVGDIGDAVNADFIEGTTGLLSIPPGANGYGGVPAAVESSGAVTFPVVITGANDTLEFKNLASAGFTTVVVASASYATMTALLAAINLVMAPTGFGNAVTDSTGTLVVIQSSVPGVGSYIDIGPGTINTVLNLTSGQTFTMPTAAFIINALDPVVTPPATGSLNVSAANLLATVGSSPNSAYVANFIAPQLQETETAIQSYQVGNMAGYLKLSWNPNPRLLPAITSGPAIQVVENDGVTPFSSSPLAPLPMITAAVHNVPNVGDITITGVGLGNPEWNAPIQSDSGTATGTIVIIREASAVVPFGNQAGNGGVPFIRLTQRQISNTFTGGTQGVVTPTSIVIPASLLTYSPGGNPFPPSSRPGTPLGVAGSTVEVKNETFGNSNYGNAASISAFNGATGIATVTGLTNQFASQVGNGYSLTISGATSPGNNGTFEIASWISATSVTIRNYSAVAPDANNTHLVWSEKAPIAFVVT